MSWNSSKYTLRKLKKQVKELRNNNVPYITADDIESICKDLSKEAAADLKENGFKHNTIDYAALKTETLIELSENILIVGKGNETVVITGEKDILD